MRAIALVAILAATPSLSEDVGPWMNYWKSADYAGAGWELKGTTSIGRYDKVILFTFWEKFLPAVVGEPFTAEGGYAVQEIGDEARHTARCVTEFGDGFAVISDACEMLKTSEK
jgi:hypothetical protein